MQKYEHSVDFEKFCKTYVLHYFVAKIGFDTDENEPAKNIKKMKTFSHNFANLLQSRSRGQSFTAPATPAGGTVKGSPLSRGGPRQGSLYSRSGGFLDFE